MESLRTTEHLPPYTRSLIEWGRSDKFAPALLPDVISSRHIRKLQDELLEQNPLADPIERPHVTIMFCPPQYLYHSLLKLREIDPALVSPQEEATFYLDVSSALSTHTLFTPFIDKMPAESVEIFDEVRGTAVLKLTHTAMTLHWRDSVRLLLTRNLRQFHGVDESEAAELRKDPKLMWLFQDSQAHISLANGVTDVRSSAAIPDAIGFDTIKLNMPIEFTGKGLFSFNDDEDEA